MRIQHNIPAMSAYRYYTNNTSALAKNLEKLSSGYKINRAGDDAAGLAISEKMRAQITGLEVAQKNAKDGISLVQTAEGALTEVHDMLNRMYSLAEQSANGTYDNDVDRKQLQKEIESLSTEINRISESANFNGIKLLNGDQGAKSLSALGEAPTVVDGSAIDGTNPSAAGAAEITVDLRSSAAVNGEVLKSNTDNDVDGSDLAKATPATFTFTLGGVAGNTTDKHTISGKVNGGANDIASNEFDTTKWDAGSYLTVTVGGKDYKFVHTTDATHTVADGWTQANSIANLDTELKKLGLTCATTGTTGVTSVGAELQKSDGTAFIDVGGTNKTYEKLMEFEPVAGTKLSEMFEIKVGDTVVTDANKTTEFKNGDVITLTAKKAGEMDTAANGVYDVLSKLKAPTSSTTTTDTTLAGKVAATNGKDVDYAAPAVTPTKYDISIDIAKLQGGQEIRIGTNKIKFVTNANTNTTGATGTGDDQGYKVYTINLNEADANANGNTDEIATNLKTVLDKIFEGTTNKFDTTKTTWTPDGSKYTYHAESLTANAGDITAANMGAVRVFEASVDGETDITDTNKAISSTYAPSKEPAAGADNNPFAQVEYTIKKDMVKAGNKITIGGKEIEFVANGDEDLAAGKVGVGNVATNLAKALEQQGYTTGKVTVTADGDDFTLKIEGTKVGESAAELKADAGKVTFMDKSKAGPNVVQVGLNGIKIEAGKTKVSDLLEEEMVAATGGSAAKTLGDLFRITDANGRELKADTVIADGQTIKFVAKDKGKLDSAIIDQLKFDSGEANITFKNGWDEGTAASGDKTHYELQFNLNNLRGGQTFTFGTDTSSVTFELTFDDVTTKNGTINDEDNTDLNGSTTGTHIKIDLGGLTTDAEKIKAIVDAVSDEMNKFDVSYSATAGKMTLMMDGKAEWNASTNDTNLGNIRVSSNNSALGSTVYNPAGGAAAGTPGTYAQIAYKFDVNQLQEGDALTVGDTTIYLGKESKVEKDGSGSKITVSLEEAKSDTNLLTQALESAGYRGGKVEFSDGKVTITGVETGETADHLKGNLGKIVLGTTTNRAMSEGGLKLQIGDTADPYNQMVVDIKSCTTSAMGLDGLNISSQANAIDSMAKIKNAINYVSDIRGGLGATQNRLDHTINNLSVMRENIQDAESTIRDVDVAEEMMAYTKNNILVQSAQAMLAQANQLPQGVLQLLQ